jgi:hypothetical protein
LSKIEKRDDDCSVGDSQQRVFPQELWGHLRLGCTESLVFKSVLARLANGGRSSEGKFTFLTTS